MSVITGVEITNFQSHRHTKLSFELGINVIVGPSNSGKSAILRAMEWCLLNTPSGTDFISVGADIAEVTLFLQNGYAVSRKRSRSNAVNTYTLLHNGSVLPDGVLTGFGSNVPPQVHDAFGMSRLEFGIAKQLEAPFLISETPKVRAETIGNLEELGKIDRALQAVNDDLRDCSKRQRELDLEIKKLSSEMKQAEKELAHDKRALASFEQQKQRHDEWQQTLFVAEQKLARMQQFASDLQDTHVHALRAMRIKNAWNPDVMDVAKQAEEMESASQRVSRLQTDLLRTAHISSEVVAQLDEQFKRTQILHQHAQQAESVMQRIQDVADRQAKSRTIRFVTVSTDRAEESITKYEALHRANQNILRMSDELEKADAERTKTIKEMQKSLTDFTAAMQDAKVCPLCEQGTAHVHPTI